MTKGISTTAMATTIDLGFLGYAPRLKKTFLSGLTKYVSEGHYGRADGDIEPYDYADWTYEVNDLCLFAFRRSKDEDGDDLDEVEIELRQKSTYGFSIIIFKCSVRFTNFDYHKPLPEAELTKVVRNILLKLNRFKNLRKVPICSACQGLGQDDKEFCVRCEEKCSFNPEKCAICIDDEDKVSVWVKLAKCGHVFHKKCISKIDESKQMCPLCRQEFSSSDVTVL